MRKTASAGRGANDNVRTETQPQAQPHLQTEAKVVQLEQYRVERLNESVAGVRSRLGELRRARVKAELSAGCLLRELAALQRELRDCRMRMTQGGMLE